MDFHTCLIFSGTFMRPAIPSGNAPQRQLRLLYECNPLALIAENAGGVASDGAQRVLDVVPTTIQTTCPLLVGPKAVLDFKT